MEVFCNSINVFTVTFDQFYTSLLNKSIQLFHWPKLLNSSVCSTWTFATVYEVNRRTCFSWFVFAREVWKYEHHFHHNSADIYVN